MESKNLVGLWSTLFRSIEIAKTGGYTISVFFDKNYKGGFDDYQEIKKFCSGWFDSFMPEGDLRVEIIKPKNYLTNIKYETKEDIEKRIQAARSFSKPKIILGETSETLLKVAINRLGLSLKQVERIKEISTTIAQVDYSKEIKTEHVAEAIQYSIIPDEVICAESKSINFGDMISIKLGDIDSKYVQRAIEYLMNF